MLAQTAADVAEALKALGGEAAFEWKMDGARIQVHKVSDEVRIYTRSFERGTGAVPGNRRDGAHVRRTRTGAAMARRSRSIPRSGRIRSRSPCAGSAQAQRSNRRAPNCRSGRFFFDCLHFEGRSIADRPTRERVQALAQAVPAPLRIPRLVTLPKPRRVPSTMPQSRPDTKASCEVLGRAL